MAPCLNLEKLQRT